MAENQSYWQKTAAQIKEQPNEDWIDLLRHNLQTCHPQKMAELAAMNDLDAYLKVMVNSAEQQYQTFLTAGVDETTALEMTMQELLQQAPEDEDRPEPWEVEGANADMVAAIEAQLLKP